MTALLASGAAQRTTLCGAAALWLRQHVTLLMSGAARRSVRCEAAACRLLLTFDERRGAACDAM